MHSIAAATGVALLLIGPVGAQPDPEPQKPPRQKAQPKAPAVQQWQSFEQYDEQRSRVAFSACDRDGDDRLNVREARACLTGMGDSDDPAGFRALDANRNGFLHWAEFDRRYRETIQRGSKFRFRPARPFTDPAGKRRTGAAAVPREQRAAALVVAMANVDDDPDISREEFRDLLKALGQPATLNYSFGAVDQDRSGGLSKAEFVPILNAVPYLAQLVLAQSGTSDPSVLRPADLTSRLARLHPVLQRWSRTIFRGADRDGNGILGSEELRTVPTPTPKDPVPRKK